MRCKYITIEREYGSGGTKIAYNLAKECNIPCYGREILEAVAAKRDISVEQIQHYEEKASSSILYTLYVMSCMQSGDTNMLTQEGQIFVEEQEQIQKLAAEGPAIFLGHCASEALKDQKGVVRVFIYADGEDKKERIKRDYGIAESRLETTQRYFDKKRSNYYHANTGRRWNDLRNYDITLNSSVLGTEGAVAVLKGLFACS